MKQSNNKSILPWKSPATRYNITTFWFQLACRLLFPQSFQNTWKLLRFENWVYAGKYMANVYKYCAPIQNLVLSVSIFHWYITITTMKNLENTHELAVDEFAAFAWNYCLWSHEEASGRDIDCAVGGLQAEPHRGQANFRPGGGSRESRKIGSIFFCPKGVGKNCGAQKGLGAGQTTHPPRGSPTLKRSVMVVSMPAGACGRISIGARHGPLLAYVWHENTCG